MVEVDSIENVNTCTNLRVSVCRYSLNMVLNLDMFVIQLCDNQYSSS